MKRDIRGLRVLITGATGGIGSALARQIATEGGRLALTARSQEALEELTQELTAPGACGTRCDAFPIPADLTSEEDRNRLLDQAVDHLGGLDVLVNNAGVASWGHFAESSEEVLRQVMEVNFFAPAELIRRAIPALTEGRQPAVVNVASMCGRRGMPAFSEYSASKFALSGLTEALRGELARFDIDILLIVPGLTQTGMDTRLLRAEGRYPLDFKKGMSAEYVASRILRALRGNSTEVCLGWEARWMLRINRFFPRLVDRLMARRIKKLYANPESAKKTG